MLVRFTRRWRMYNTGETAAFDQAVANQLIEQGFAVIDAQPVAQQVQKEKPAPEKKPVPE
jgi:hypothetical protein